MRIFSFLTVIAGCAMMLVSSAGAQDMNGQTYRLYEGITAYINNPRGQNFTMHLELRDLHLFAGGAHEVLLKIYDPDGVPVVREFLPCDGVTSGNFPDRIGGWDHELQYYANLYAKGTMPSFRWSAWSDPNRLKTIVPQVVVRNISGKKKGIYRIVLAGNIDDYATLTLQPALKFGVAGHTTWMHGHGSLLKKSYVYIPKGSCGLFFAVAEPDMPRTRHFKLTGPDGAVLFDGMATGGYAIADGKNGQTQSLDFPHPADYEGKLLTLDVSDGANDYLVKITLKQPMEGAFKDYVGMGSQALFATDPDTAMALQGGTFVEDGLVFWHPFQARFYRWLKAHPFSADAQQQALRKELQELLTASACWRPATGAVQPAGPTGGMASAITVAASGARAGCCCSARRCRRRSKASFAKG